VQQLDASKKENNKEVIQHRAETMPVCAEFKMKRRRSLPLVLGLFFCSFPFLLAAANGMNWVKYAGNPVFVPAAAGAWDDADVFSVEVLHDGAKFRMYYTGKGRLEKEQIGYAISGGGGNL
jgi:hypothetical protein